MRCGTPGKILRVDLSRSSIEVETFSESFYRLYPGGKALAAYYLLKETPPQADPLGPDNVLILAAGLVTGAPISVASRFSALAKSPLTGGYGESEAGGFWGSELKFAGFEAIIVKGRADHPVYLWVKDGQAEIRDARGLWGCDPDIVQQRIRTDLDDQLIRVLQIGIGGENLVRFAAITNEMRHFNGRSGLGAVMGSKNLKAVAVRGSTRYSDYANNYPALSAMGKKLAKEARQHPQAWDLYDKGSPGLVTSLDAAGILPTRNFHQGSFEHAKEIGWDTYQTEIFTGRRTCFACAVSCKREVEANDRYSISHNYGGPEYETLAAFGSDCGISDLLAVAKANELCNRFVLDTISTGATIAFAMECFENGLITLKDTEGLELRFGNAEAMVKMVERIARREGLGRLLAEGSLRAAESIGGRAREFSMNVKGQELPMHDPRGKVGLGLGFAVAESGADHISSAQDTLLAKPDSITFKGGQSIASIEALSIFDLSEKKAAVHLIFEKWNSFEKTAGFCFFGLAPRSFIQGPDVLAVVNAASGWNLTMDELLTIGERGVNLARVFNVLVGFTRKQDSLPERLFGPLENGLLEGKTYPREEFENALTALYQFKGWDPVTAAPTRAKLRQLGIEWAADLAGIQ